MNQTQHTMRIVTQRTGLSPHVIRVWERRYGAVRPVRTDTNRRLYSEVEVERLRLLRTLTQSGHSIRTVARLSVDRLRLLVGQPVGLPEAVAVPRSLPLPVPDELQECVAAVRSLDARRLERVLRQATLTLGQQGALQRVVAPLSQTIGDLWRAGEITAAHEHFGTVVIRTFLGQAVTAYGGEPNAPVLIVATPTGQLHELGALLAGAAAARLGWVVSYLGASLPAVEIAGAAFQARARAVALSLVYPEDDPLLPAELAHLRELLPTEVPVLVGGRAGAAYARAIEQAGASRVNSLDEFCLMLDELRKPGMGRPGVHPVAVDSAMPTTC